LPSIFDPLAKWFVKNVPSIESRYPKTWKVETKIARFVRNILLSEELVHEYGAYFKGKSLEELDALAKSFSFEHCERRTRLNEILMKDNQS
jgi:hypothetical protein